MIDSSVSFSPSDLHAWARLQLQPLGINNLLLICLYIGMTVEASAEVIDGKSIAKQIKDEITAEICRMKDATGVVPGLAVILVGARKDSQTYVRSKKKACEAVGITSHEVHLPEDCSEEEVLNSIAGFNNDPSVHGILVQLPLPRVCLFHSRVLFLTVSIFVKSCSIECYCHSLWWLSSSKPCSIHLELALC